MRSNSFTTLVLLSAIAALALSACSDDPYGIFASITREQEIVYDRNLDADLTIGAMAKAGTTYFLAAGTLFHREQDTFAAPVSGGDPQWQRPEWLAVTAPTTNTLTTAVVSVDFGAGERVFAVYTSLDGESSGLYEIDRSDPSSAPELRFEPPELAQEGTDASLGELFVASDASTTWLLVNYTVDGTHSLHASSNGVDFTEIAETSASVPYVDVASDGTALAYVRPDAILSDGDGVGGAAPAPVTAGLVAPARFTGAIYDAAGGVFWFADDSGFLYTSPDLAVWTRPTEAYLTDPEDATSDPLRFTDFAAVGRGLDTYLLAGTAGAGYRVIAAAAGPGTNAETGVSLPSGENYSSSDLTTATVRTWFVDPVAVTDYPVSLPSGGTTQRDGYFVFAGTPSRSLWRGLWPVAESIHWVREARDPGLFGSR